MALDVTAPDMRRALVTGGAAGIGWAICQRLAAEGYRVALADIDASLAKDRTAELGPGHVALAADLTDPETASRLPGRAAQVLGGLQIIVNNAGITDNSGRSLIDLPQDSFDRLVALNLTSVQRVCAAAADILPSGSRIVNLASGAAYRPLALRGPYSATKAGIVALTRALGHNLAARGIVVSAVAPGYTRTPLVEALSRAGRVDFDTVAKGIPLGRVAEPEDIAGTVAFCAGPKSTALAGRTLLVDGGGSVGPAPRDTAPAPGTAPRGSIAVLGPLDIHGALVEATNRDRLGDLGQVSAVIDCTALDGKEGPAEALDAARRTALACAAHEGRARNFALLYVAAADSDPGISAASAAQSMFARTLALEWAPAGMRVNAVIWHGRSRSGLSEICRFLTGPDAGFITGQFVEAGDPFGKAGGSLGLKQVEEGECDMWSKDLRTSLPGS